MNRLENLQKHGVLVFPAHAGMNRQTCDLSFLPASVPRTRGDEPTLQELVLEQMKCSPHTRG